MKQRVKKVIITLSIIIAAGLAYAVFWTVTGIAIPCAIYEVTGIYCPGCGVSRMCLSLLHFDFYQAFRYNPGAIIVSPVLIWYFIHYIITYLKGESTKITKGQQRLFVIVIIVLILFGIARNIPFFHYLKPTIV